MKKIITTLALALLVSNAMAGLTRQCVYGPVADCVATVTTQSIEVNGKSYAPGSTVTLTNPNITWRAVLATSEFTKIYPGGGIIAYFASLCTDTASCVLDGTGKFSSNDSAKPTQNSDLATATVSSGTYQVYYSNTTNSFFSVPAHAETIYGQSLGLTFVVVTPAAYGLKSNGGAVSTITANAGVQALTATVTPRSDDVGAAGQLYVAALLADGSVYFKTPAAPSGWAQWKKESGTPIPVLSSVTLATSNTVEIGSYDLAGLAGATIYVGYGKGTGAAAEADLLTGKFSGWPIK